MSNDEIIADVLKQALGVITSRTGQQPVAAVLVVSFPNVEQSFASFMIAKVMPQAMLKLLDTLSMRFNAEIRAAKVRANSVRRTES